MRAERLDKDQLYAKLATLDEAALRKVVWQVYWRGPAPVRERVEALLDPTEAARARPQPDPVDAPAVLEEVRELAKLARAGAYLAGDRRVSPTERKRWRFTFRQLAEEAVQALHGEDLDIAATAVETLVDLACETAGYDYFRSEDPMQAAGVVVSDAVAALWRTVRDRHGFAVFAERAAPQLLRWETPHGWTRYGTGRVADKETTLAGVLTGLLEAPDHWTAFATRYLEALDATSRRAGRTGTRLRHAPGRDRTDRARRLAGWHDLLIDRLVHSEAEELLDRLAAHPALDGPELTFVAARLAEQRQDADRARSLVQECLQHLPGHRGFLDLADRVGAERPSRQGALRRG